MKKDRKSASNLVDYLLILPEEFAWYTGLALRGFNVTVKPSGALLIVKATKGSAPVVAFYDAENIVDAFRYFYVNMRAGNIVWRPDRYGK